MHPFAKALLTDLNASLASDQFDQAKVDDLLRRCISYVQATADPENQPSQFGTILRQSASEV